MAMRFSAIHTVIFFSAFAFGGCFAASNEDGATAAEDDESLATVALGVDTNGSTLDIGHAQGAGIGFVGRYVSFDGTHPVLDAIEVSRFIEAKMPLIAIWETGQLRAIGLGSESAEYGAGVTDAKLAAAALIAADGAGKPVYFTVDFDVTHALWNEQSKDSATGKKIIKGDLILAYFRGVKSVIGVPRIGAYGTYTTISQLFDAGLITYGWQQTFGSRGDQVDPRAQLRQYNITADQTGWGVGGAGALDLDRAVKTSFGQW